MQLRFCMRVSNFILYFSDKLKLKLYRMMRVAIDKAYLCCYMKKIFNIISSKFLCFENFFQDYFFYKISRHA